MKTTYLFCPPIMSSSTCDERLPNIMHQARTNDRREEEGKPDRETTPPSCNGMLFRLRRRSDIWMVDGWMTKTARDGMLHDNLDHTHVNLTNPNHIKEPFAGLCSAVRRIYVPFFAASIEGRQNVSLRIASSPSVCFLVPMCHFLVLSLPAWFPGGVAGDYPNISPILCLFCYVSEYMIGKTYVTPPPPPTSSWGEIFPCAVFHVSLANFLVCIFV